MPVAITCTSANLADLAKCFCGLSPVQRESVKIYLLAVLAGVTPDAEELATLSKCFCGLSQEQRDRVQTYLLCQIANLV